MRKVIFALMAVAFLAISCTKEEVSNEEIETLSPDKDKVKCTGCN